MTNNTSIAEAKRRILSQMLTISNYCFWLDNRSEWEEFWPLVYEPTGSSRERTLRSLLEYQEIVPIRHLHLGLPLHDHRKDMLRLNHGIANNLFESVCKIWIWKPVAFKQLPLTIDRNIENKKSAIQSDNRLLRAIHVWTKY